MADSEVRQKFEAWWKSERDADIVAGPHLKLCCLNAYSAGMRAGEIAMKEKAAQLANSCAQILSPEHRVGATWIGDKIRALPLSGAEESKK